MTGKTLPGQVSFYTTGEARVSIHFPEDDIRCVWCPYCRDEANMRRWWCRLTNRVIVNPEFAGLPEFCPIEFITEELDAIKKAKEAE